MLVVVDFVKVNRRLDFKCVEKRGFVIVVCGCELF